MGKMKFNISSLIENIDSSGLPEGEPERESFSTEGELVCSDEAYILSYTEAREGGAVECEITLRGDKASVVRRGAVECKMYFKRGMTHSTVYKVPPFSFDMRTETVRVDNGINESGGKLSLLYKMNIGGQDKRCRFTLEAK